MTSDKSLKKVLVIGHSNFWSTYGAATSIRSHHKIFIENNHYQLFHIYRREILKSNYNDCYMDELFDPESEWIEINSKMFKHKDNGFFKKTISEHIPNKISRIFSSRLISKIKLIDPEIIHLNSIVLFPFLHFLKFSKIKKCKIIMHIREVINPEAKNYAMELLRYVDQFVFIDSTTRNEFVKVFPLPSDKMKIVLNPFIINRKGSFFKKLVPGKFVFAIVGGIYHDKGVEFVCDAFLKAKIENSILYIIGRKNSLAKKIELSHPSNKIMWLDEIPNFGVNGGFYEVDCLIRGDPIFCSGRSVFEALYSGSNVIIPGSIDDVNSDKFLADLKNNVFVYSPRNSDSLISALQSVVACPKRLDFEGECNTLEFDYLRNFYNIYD
jgi:hypothetical protein